MVRFWYCPRAKGIEMKRNEFRDHAALLILTVILDKTTNPAKAAVMWANELVKELYGTERKKGKAGGRH